MDSFSQLYPLENILTLSYILASTGHGYILRKMYDSRIRVELSTYKQGSMKVRLLMLKYNCYLKITEVT